MFHPFDFILFSSLKLIRAKTVVPDPEAPEQDVAWYAKIVSIVGFIQLVFIYILYFVCLLDTVPNL